MKTVRIGLDAQYDLGMADLPTDEQTIQDFEEAYNQAAEEYGQIAGIEIEVKKIGYGTPSERNVDHCPQIWEDLHTCLDYTDHFVVNKERLRMLANSFKIQSLDNIDEIDNDAPKM